MHFPLGELIGPFLSRSGMPHLPHVEEVVSPLHCSSFPLEVDAPGTSCPGPPNWGLLTAQSFSLLRLALGGKHPAFSPGGAWEALPSLWGLPTIMRHKSGPQCPRAPEGMRLRPDESPPSRFMPPSHLSRLYLRALPQETACPRGQSQVQLLGNPT